MAALLLDNEAEAVSYQRATLGEILRNHVLPLGIRCASEQASCDAREYAVASGASQWKALKGFAERCGLTPYFSAEGTLFLRTKAEGGKHTLDTPGALREALYRDRRYGVLSEVLVINRSRDLRQVAKNEAFAARGGQCRRVVYAPSRSANELRYTGEYQIDASRAGARELTLVFDGAVDVEPMDRVRLRLEPLGIEGNFRVNETLYAMSARGETTELTLWEEE